MAQGIIKLLPEYLANQIAAGEVVQRPASVVKELLENAIDAQATEIKLLIRDAGKALIQVIDNGVGMSETDARMCFERHATSKITKPDDLFRIYTMGFRGEAMASIAAVAQVELKTRQHDAELGVLVRIEGSQIKEHSLTACATGTSVSVKNLFYNVPARRNFLKSNGVEFNHVYDEFLRIALAHPDKSFAFYHNDEEVHVLAPSKLAQRIIHLLGAHLKSKLAPCKEDTPLIHIQGYVGKPDTAKKKRGEQFFFVNNRFVKNAYLHHAVCEAYQNFIENDSHPTYVLFISIDPTRIDINVHPTKTEIKFDDERTVYGLVNSAVKKALSAFHFSEGLDFSENINFNIITQIQNTQKQPIVHSTPVFRSTHSHKDWETLYESIKNDKNTAFTPATEELRFESQLNKAEQPIANYSYKECYQVHAAYIVTQSISSLLIIDQQAAHERILYDKFQKNLTLQKGASQQILFPFRWECSPTDFALLHELHEWMQQLGFVYEPFGSSEILVTGVPADVKPGSEREVLEAVIEQIKWNKTELKLPLQECTLRALAKRMSIKKGITLSTTEMQSLVEQLMSSTQPAFTPDGRTIICAFDSAKLQALFE